MYKHKHPEYFERVVAITREYLSKELQADQATVAAPSLLSALSRVEELARHFGGAGEGGEEALGGSGGGAAGSDAGAAADSADAAAAAAAAAGASAPHAIPPGSRFAFPALEIVALLERRKAEELVRHSAQGRQAFQHSRFYHQYGGAGHYDLIASGAALRGYPLGDRLLTYRQALERALRALGAHAAAAAGGGAQRRRRRQRWRQRHQQQRPAQGLAGRRGAGWQLRHCAGGAGGAGGGGRRGGRARRGARAGSARGVLPGRR